MKRTREGTLLMPEQLRSDQRVWDSGAIHTEEGAIGALRAFVDGTGDQFLTRTRLTGNQNCRIGRRYLCYISKYCLQRRRGPDDLLEHRCVIDFFAQSNVLVLDSLFSLLAIFDIGRRDIPANDVSFFISHWVMAEKKPAILPVAAQ